MLQQKLKGSMTALQQTVGSVWAAMLGGRGRSLSQPMVSTAFSFMHCPAAHPANMLQEHSDIKVIFSPLLHEWRQNILLRQELKVPWSPTSDLNNLQSFPCTSYKCWFSFCPLLCPCFTKFLQHLRSCSARQTSGDIPSSQHWKNSAFLGRMQITKVWLYDM